MEKEFIPYELALALKELGFDEPCCQAYHTNGENELSAFYSNPNIVDEWLKKLPLIKAPLFQQAFRWFREKYNLDSEIYMNHELGVKFQTYLILQLEHAVITHKSGYTGRFGTYEEAELECLKKLIEIVKEK